MNRMEQTVYMVPTARKMYARAPPGITSMSMMNIVREVYQEATDTFRTLVRVSKTTPALLRNLKEFQEGCKEYLKNRELTISLVPVDRYLEHISQHTIEVLEKNRQALRCLLRFTLNLCTDPSREEYHIIKKYTAFFQCNVDGIFSFSDDYLGMIGYKVNPEADEYRLERIPDNIIEIAFNTFLTTIEFERVIDFAKDAKKEGFSVAECLQARKEINETMSGWTSVAGLKWLKEKQALERKTVQVDLDEGFSKSSDSDRLKYGGNQYSSGDMAGYRYNQDTGGDSYLYGDTSSNREGSSKFATDTQERTRTDVNRSYSPMRGKEQFYSGDRRASDNNYQTSDSYKGSMFLDNRNDISDHELYGDSQDSVSNEAKDRSTSPSGSLCHSGRSSDVKGSVDIYNGGQYSRSTDKQYIGINDDRSRSSETVEKLSSSSTYSSEKSTRDLISDSDSRASAVLSGKDTIISSRVPSERLSGRSSSVSIQRVRGTTSDVISDTQSTSSVIFGDKTKEIVTSYDTSNCETPSGKASYRTYDQGTVKKTDRAIGGYGKSNESTFYSQAVTGQRYLQGDVVSDVTRETPIYRSTQTRSKTDISARGVNDFTNLQMPSIYKS